MLHRIYQIDNSLTYTAYTVIEVVNATAYTVIEVVNATAVLICIIQVQSETDVRSSLHIFVRFSPYQEPGSTSTLYWTVRTLDAGVKNGKSRETLLAFSKQES